MTRVELSFPLTEGLYETRDGRIASVTEIGSFAYGKLDGNPEFWCLDSGECPEVERPGPDPRDLVKRIPGVA